MQGHVLSLGVSAIHTTLLFDFPFEAHLSNHLIHVVFVFVLINVLRSLFVVFVLSYCISKVK